MVIWNGIISQELGNIVDFQSVESVRKMVLFLITQSVGNGSNGGPLMVFSGILWVGKHGIIMVFFFYSSLVGWDIWA